MKQLWDKWVRELSSRIRPSQKQSPEDVEPERIHIDPVDPDPMYGLTEDEVDLRLDGGWDNRPVDADTRTIQEIIKKNTFTYFNLIFAVLGVLLILVGAIREMSFLGVIICNTMIGIVQEIRSKKVLDDLKILNESKVWVIREGKRYQVPVGRLVVDDIIELTGGAQIPADAVVRQGSIQVNEALLTGEADEITKEPGAELMSGSFVIGGRCLAQLTQVGADSYISQLTLKATKQKGVEQSEMIRSLDRLVQIVGIIIIPIGILLFYQQFMVSHNTFRDSVTSMVAAVIGMIPEGLYLTASVALVVSAMRLARQQVLLHDMKCIETLARVTVLCVDKTGTITEDRMEVKGVMSREELEEGLKRESSLEVIDIGESPKKESSLEIINIEETPHENHQEFRGNESFVELLSDFAQAMTADNSTMAALKEHFRSGRNRRPETIIPFSSRVKYSGAIFQGVSYVLGAPEFVLREEYDKYREALERQAEKGCRVLAFCEYEGIVDGEPLQAPVKLLGIVLLSNRVRAGAAETFRYFAERQVDIKVISGDNPVSVSAIAKEAGIVGAEHYVDATTLTSQEDMARAMEEYTVFGRVTPEQKRQFVQVLKEQGETVAMTGDGVNDVLALKDADCSIAMASGSEAASQVSQLVLLDSDFSRMPAVVLEGRRVVNNIERTASLFLVKNIFSLLLAVFSVILVLEYPLEAPQVSLIGMFTIGIPAFILSQEPNKNPIRGHFLTNVLLRALPAGLTDFAIVLALVLFCKEFGVDSECMSTACTLLIALVGFMIMYRIMGTMNRFHWILLISMMAGLGFCMLKMSWFFAITGITRQVCMLMIVFGIIAEPMMRYLGKITEWAQKKLADKYQNRRKRKVE